MTDDHSTAAPPQLAPAVAQAVTLIGQNRLSDAEAIVRSHLATHPDDVFALCVLGDLAARSGLLQQSAELFRRVLDLQPSFDEAKANLAKAMIQQGAIGEAVELMREVVVAKPDDPRAEMQLYMTLAQLARYEEAERGYADLVDRHPANPNAWLGYGNLLKTIGKPSESAAALRRAIGLDPRIGDAWWALANLKFVDFAPDEISSMRDLLASNPAPKLAWELNFTLGRAFEQAGSYADSFAHYAEGNRLRHAAIRSDPAEVHDEVARVIDYESRDRRDCERRALTDDPVPIFVVGMPRAGSTLVEQILASHPLIEGTSELPIIPMLIQNLIAERWPATDVRYPGIMKALDDDRVAELRRSYLDTASLYRRSDRPYFIDKQPNNWRNLSFIMEILPEAIIIDARRDPLSCCLSNFKQYYARGQEFSYSFAEMAAYYASYVRLTAHLETVRPGKVHLVQHEKLVADPETEIGAMLAHIGVAYDPGCLDFHKNTRPVRTASSEQVRRPLSSAGLNQWENFAPWLGELRAELTAAGLA
ncbi:MAG: sulfotransferase [Sphingomonas sp.]